MFLIHLFLVVTPWGSFFSLQSISLSFMRWGFLTFFLFHHIRRCTLGVFASSGIPRLFLLSYIYLYPTTTPSSHLTSLSRQPKIICNKHSYWPILGNLPSFYSSRFYLFYFKNFFNYLVLFQNIFEYSIIWFFLNTFKIILIGLNN